MGFFYALIKSLSPTTTLNLSKLFASLMSFWLRFPLARITIIFSLGIITATNADQYISLAAKLLTLCLIGYTWMVWYIRKINFYQWKPYVGLLGFTTIFLMGYLCLIINTPSRFKNHLTQNKEKIEAYRAVAIENTSIKNEVCSTLVTLQSVRISGKWQKKQGKIKLFGNIKDFQLLQYGDVLLVRGSPQKLEDPKNPNEFNYKQWLHYQQIDHQHFIKTKHYSIINYSPPNYIKAIACKFRRRFAQILEKQIKHTDARGIALALLLGIKEEIPADIRSMYACAGIMHILAVSGLHVGMLYAIFLALFSLLGRVSPIRRLSTWIALGFLWQYAFLTGLSSSIVRATTMFSFSLLAKEIRSSYNNYNILSAAALLLLLYDPWLIYSIGFQLSFLAVLGIIYLQPKLHRFFTFHNWFLKQLWMATSVSIAAQILTTPLTLYYFHNFPTYFIIANWVVIPATFLMLGLGILVLSTSWWIGLSSLIALLLEKLIIYTNQFVGWINLLPGHVITVMIDLPMMILIYIFTGVTLLFLHYRKFTHLVLVSTIAIMIGSWSMFLHYKEQAQTSIIFHYAGNNIVTSFTKGKTSIITTGNPMSTNDKAYRYHVLPSQKAMGIETTYLSTFKVLIKEKQLSCAQWNGLKIAVWEGKKIVWIDKECISLPNFREKIAIDYCVVEGNAIKSLSTLMNRFVLGTLIIGTTNRKYLAGKLAKQAQQANIKCHIIKKEGALIQ